MKNKTKKYYRFPRGQRLFLASLGLWAALVANLPLQAQPGKVTTNGITLAYEILGAKHPETILLIAGTGMQLTAWPNELCQELVRRGYRVVRFDNRDVGLSTKFEAAGEPNWPAILDSLAQGKPAPLAYTVDEMAQDAVGLLTALGIPKAHIVGISGGATIAQIIAARYPERTRSLTALMATTGNPQLPPMKPEIQQILVASPPALAGDTVAIVARQVQLLRALGSPAYPVEEQSLRAWALRDTRRSYYPAGAARQGAAALAAGDRRPALRTITVPTVVVHGEADPLVPVAAGKEVAATIPGAELRLLPGMGHNLPSALLQSVVDAILAAATGPKNAN